MASSSPAPRCVDIPQVTTQVTTLAVDNGAQSQECLADIAVVLGEGTGHLTANRPEQRDGRPMGTATSWGESHQL